MGDTDHTAPTGESEWTFRPGDIQLTETILGRGAFGEVRIAKWRSIPVACKSLHSPDPSSRESIDRDDLKHEISMLSKLRHPNLVLFIGVCHGLVGNTTSILTELLPCSLYDILEVNKTVLGLPDILDIALDIVHGLDYLHKHYPQIVHRDISAKNILIGGTKAKIADLGQAKLFGHNTLSRQTGMPGAMAYSAPEVLTGKYSAKIDLFSFGILLAQMCTGEYPRIDRREDQIARACEAQPLFSSLIQSSVSYQPHERPTAELACRELEAIKENDRYYPVSRTIAPEKDIGILGRQWMETQIEAQCAQVSVELHRTKSLLAAEETRWRTEAAKVDDINDQLREARTQRAGAREQLARLQTEHSELQLSFRTADGTITDLRAQLAALSSEIQRLQGAIGSKDTQLAQQWQDLTEHQTALSRYQDEYQMTAQLLEAARRSEADLLKRNEQLKLQLDMQVEYVRDLEGRLEQALTRWKLEKDTLREEKARYSKLNAHSATIVAANDRLKQDIARYEARLAQYADLPMPEELKERFKDMQDDAQLARDEVASLLRQRDEWTETKSAFEQTIVDLHHREGERDEQDRQRQAESQRHSEEIQGLEQRLREADQRERDRQQQIASLEGEIQRMREGEEQLKETLRKTRVALSKEKTRVEQYRIAAANPVAMMASPTSQQQQPPTAASAEPNEDDDAGSQQTAETRRDGPYVLQQDMISSPARGVPVIDLDDEEVRPAVMRTLVPSVTRLAEIEAIHAANPPRGDERTDIGIKHIINAAAESGAEDLIQAMLEGKEDERVVWRGARALRELILKDEAVKIVCYGSNIEVWLTAMINAFAMSAVAQGHCMRLIGALAFGNDRFRRKAGEQGILTAIVRALELHGEDETVMLHVSTAITNLTHNSFENRSRFLEMEGVDLLIAMMVRFKESAKLQRQACWAVLSLCGTDEISRIVAQRGGDSAIMNAMLHHRFDAGVQQFGCWALSNLALSGEEVMRRMKKKGAVEVCRIAIESHPKNPEVLRQARNAMGAFAPLAGAGPVGQTQTQTAGSSAAAAALSHSASAGHF